MDNDMEIPKTVFAGIIVIMIVLIAAMWSVAVQRDSHRALLKKMQWGTETSACYDCDRTQEDGVHLANCKIWEAIE